jgi:hypothetical protein
VNNASDVQFSDTPPPPVMSPRDGTPLETADAVDNSPASNHKDTDGTASAQHDKQRVDHQVSPAAALPLSDDIMRQQHNNEERRWMRCEAAAAVIVSSDNTALQSQRRHSRLTAHSSVLRAALATAAEDYSVIDGVSSHLHDEERALLLLVPPVAFLQKIWALSVSTEEAVASLSNIESARASCAANIRLHLDDFQKTNGRAAVGAVRACAVQLCTSYSPAKKSENMEMQSFFDSACCLLYLSILLTSVSFILSPDHHC